MTFIRMTVLHGDFLMFFQLRYIVVFTCLYVHDAISSMFFEPICCGFKLIPILIYVLSSILMHILVVV